MAIGALMASGGVAQDEVRQKLDPGEREHGEREYGEWEHGD